MYERESRASRIVKQRMPDTYSVQFAYGKRGHERWVTLEGDYTSLSDAVDMWRTLAASDRLAGFTVRYRVVKLHMTTCAKPVPVGDWVRAGIEPPYDLQTG